MTAWEGQSGQPGYAGQPPGYGGQPPGYGSQPPGYGSPPPAVYGYGAPQGPYGGYGARHDYASFGARFVATIVDGFISVLAFSVVALLLVLVGVASTEFEPGTCTSSTGVTTTCDVPTPATVGVWFLLAGIGFVAYFGVIFMFLIRPVGRSGQTIGRRMMNIRVVDIATGQPIGVGMAILRYLVAGFISGFFYIGYLWMLWDDQSQTLHDKVANAIVVNARR